MLNVYEVYYGIQQLVTTVRYKRIQKTEMTCKFSQLQHRLSGLHVFKLISAALVQITLLVYQMLQITKSWQRYAQIGHDVYFSLIGVIEGIIMLRIGSQYKYIAEEISFLNQNEAY